MANVVEFSVKCPVCWVTCHRLDDGTVIAARGGRFHGLGLCVHADTEENVEEAAENVARAVRSSGLDPETFHQSQFDKVRDELMAGDEAGVDRERLRRAHHEAEDILDAAIARFRAARDAQEKAMAEDAAAAAANQRVAYAAEMRADLEAALATHADVLRANLEAKIAAHEAASAPPADGPEVKIGVDVGHPAADETVVTVVTVAPTPVELPAVESPTETATAPVVSPEPSPEPEAASNPAKGKKGK